MYTNICIFMCICISVCRKINNYVDVKGILYGFPTFVP